MGIEGEPIKEEYLRRAPVDARIHEEEELEEVTPQKQPDSDEESEIESMKRQVPPEIVEGMPGG